MCKLGHSKEHSHVGHPGPLSPHHTPPAPAQQDPTICLHLHGCHPIPTSWVPLPQSWSLWSLLHQWPQDLVKPHLGLRPHSPRMSLRLGFQDGPPMCPQASGLEASVPSSVKWGDRNGDFSILRGRRSADVLPQGCHLSRASPLSPVRRNFSSSSRPHWASLPHGVHTYHSLLGGRVSPPATHPKAPVSLGSNITSSEKPCDAPNRRTESPHHRHTYSHLVRATSMCLPPALDPSLPLHCPSALKEVPRGKVTGGGSIPGPAHPCAPALHQLVACSKCPLDYCWVTATGEVTGEPSRHDNATDLLLQEASQPVPQTASCPQTGWQQAQNHSHWDGSPRQGPGACQALFYGLHVY